MADCSRPGDQQQEVLSIMRVYSSVGDSTFQRGGSFSLGGNIMGHRYMVYGRSSNDAAGHSRTTVSSSSSTRLRDRQTDEQTDIPTNEQADKQTNQQTNRWTDGHRRRVNPSFYGGCLIVKGRHEDLRYSEKSASNTEYKRTKNMR